MKRFWKTPPELYEKLNLEFQFDFDPCPYPRPEGHDGLKVDWGNSNYVNPPFLKKDGSPTAFVRKAIEENKKGKRVVLTLSVPSYVNLLLEAGAKLRSLGRVKWLEVETGEEMKAPGPVTCFILENTEEL